MPILVNSDLLVQLLRDGAKSYDLEDKWLRLQIMYVVHS
jgi:hypothetical protein